MHVSGPMVVWVNYNPQSVYFTYFWHCIIKPKRLGYFLIGPFRRRAALGLSTILPQENIKNESSAPGQVERAL
jgi:hypothetical protein